MGVNEKQTKCPQDSENGLPQQKTSKKKQNMFKEILQISGKSQSAG